LFILGRIPTVREKICGFYRTIDHKGTKGKRNPQVDGYPQNKISRRLTGVRGKTLVVLMSTRSRGSNRETLGRRREKEKKRRRLGG